VFGRLVVNSILDQRNDFEGFIRNCAEFTARYLGSGSPILERKVETVLARIEGVRLLLSPGVENPIGILFTGALTTAPLREATDNVLVTQAIIDADQGRIAQARTVCERLLGSIGCNLTNQAICRIILAGDETTPAAERLTNYRRAEKTLTSIHSVPNQWSNELRTMIGLAQTRIFQLSSEVLDDIMDLQICCGGR